MRRSAARNRLILHAHLGSLRCPGAFFFDRDERARKLGTMLSLDPL